MKTIRILTTLWFAFMLLLPVGALSQGTDAAKACCGKRAHCHCCFQPASPTLPQTPVSSPPLSGAEVAPAPLIDLPRPNVVALSRLNPLSSSSSQLIAADATRHRLTYQRACSLLL